MYQDLTDFNVNPDPNKERKIWHHSCCGFCIYIPHSHLNHLCPLLQQSWLVGCGSSTKALGTKAWNSPPVPRDRQLPHIWGTEMPTQTPSRESNPGCWHRSPNACLCANCSPTSTIFFSKMPKIVPDHQFH